MKRKRILLFLIGPVILSALIFSPVQSALQLAATPTPDIDAEEYHWDLSDIYENDTAWEKDFTLVKDEYLPEYSQYEGHMDDADSVIELYEMDDEVGRILDKLHVYAYMKLDEDQTSSIYSEMASRISSLYNDVYTAASFETPELMALPDEVLRSYIQHEDLKVYAHVFEDLLREKEHILSIEEEHLLAMAGEMAAAPDAIASKIREADLQFPVITDKDGNEIQLSEEIYGTMMNQPDRDLRKDAYNGIMGAYENSIYSLAAALDAQVRTDVFYAQARQYDSSLESALSGANIPVDVYENLLQTTKENLPIMHRYVTFRKNTMGVDVLHGYDMSIPLVEDLDHSFSYEETKQILNEALAPLGEDYLEKMNEGFDERWIDVYPDEYKTSGAYQWGAYDTHPYILANYTDSLDGLLTIAHEMGHAMNFVYSNEEQPYIYYDVSTFNAEIASTTNELLVLNYLLEHAESDEEKFFYLDRMAYEISGSFFSQVRYADFELQIHQRVEDGDALTVEYLNQLHGDLLVEYLGEDYHLDDIARTGWTGIPHFYYNFYVYQYATGLAASYYFAGNILSGEPGAVDEYLQFLSAGNSDYPIEILKETGIDMTDSEPVEYLFEEFDRILDQMESLQDI